MADGTYKLEELAREGGTSARTVRYYVQRGLLPAPVFRGKETAYDRGHLVRLRAIRKLQEAFFPLDAIAIELESRTLEELEQIASGFEAAPASTRQKDEAPPSVPAKPPTAERPSGTTSTPNHPFPARTFHRIELAPGVELSIAADAPPASRLVVERILHHLDE